MQKNESTLCLDAKNVVEGDVELEAWAKEKKWERKEKALYKIGGMRLELGC